MRRDPEKGAVFKARFAVRVCERRGNDRAQTQATDLQPLPEQSPPF